MMVKWNMRGRNVGGMSRFYSGKGFHLLNAFLNEFYFIYISGRSSPPFSTNHIETKTFLPNCRFSQRHPLILIVLIAVVVIVINVFIVVWFFFVAVELKFYLIAFSV